MGKAFASPRRLELLDLLAQAPRTVDELARASDQSTANTSQHLQALHAAGMVTRTREGTSMRYALAGDEVVAAVAGAARRLGRPAGRGRARRARLPRRRGRRDRPRRADRPAAQGRRRARRRAPRRGVRGRAHRGRALDPDRRARETGWPSCRPTARSWPTAAGRSAPTRTRPCAGCSAAAVRRGASRTAGRSGGSPSQPTKRRASRVNTARRSRCELHAGAWMRANLTTQGYCLSDAERRELAVGLRFSTGSVPEPRRRRARAAIPGHGVRALRGRRRRGLHRPPSVRLPLEPRRAPPLRRPALPPNPAPAARRVQGRDRLARARRDPARRGRDDGRARRSAGCSSRPARP